MLVIYPRTPGYIVINDVSYYLQIGLLVSGGSHFGDAEEQLWAGIGSYHNHRFLAGALVASEREFSRQAGREGSVERD